MLPHTQLAQACPGQHHSKQPTMEASRARHPMERPVKCGMSIQRDISGHTRRGMVLEPRHGERSSLLSCRSPCPLGEQSSEMHNVCVMHVIISMTSVPVPTAMYQNPQVQTTSSVPIQHHRAPSSLFSPLTCKYFMRQWQSGSCYYQHFHLLDQ